MITVIESDLKTKSTNDNNDGTTCGNTNNKAMPSTSTTTHNTINSKVTNHHAGFHSFPAPTFCFLAPPIAWSLALIAKPEPVPRPPTPDPYPPPAPIFWKALWVYMMAPVHPAMFSETLDWGIRQYIDDVFENDSTSCILYLLSAYSHGMFSTLMIRLYD
ncbi:hypothetical protein E4T39_05031 [Aureobasidium subglaciale]|nr:hypothetical protein E4T39_05031 [Aureobasidium subglaciale]